MIDEAKKLKLLKKYSGLHTEKILDTDSYAYSCSFVHRVIKNEIYRSKRFERNLSIVIFSIDLLVGAIKDVPIGLESIKNLSLDLISNVRPTDLIARYSPDSFLIVLPETDKSGAITLAKRLGNYIKRNYNLRCSYEISGFYNKIQYGNIKFNCAGKSKATLIAKLKELEQEASKDVLTGLFNRKHMNYFILAEISRYQRYGAHFSLMLIDLDNFKTINDTQGHLIGDRVLKEVGNSILKNSRTPNICIRYGGDEFLIILPDTDFRSAKAAKMRLYDAIYKDTDMHCSIGTSTIDKNLNTVKLLLEIADKRLYKDKHKKRT